eukprot:TRINITY_DN4593_c0_g1_i2.p1 TRINITY_DN4593_c0_g1~~TRINITY_DN4593_c0_g1_i2.p1  ORF type:complete len:342 (-),score=114.25 TRINITY_DN4593_c0_g1_i2:111-1136(-)
MEKELAGQKRDIINKMEEAKYQVQKNFEEKLESYRKRFERQVADLRRDQKQEYQNYNLTMTLKLENCQAENREWARKTEEAKDLLRLTKSNVAKLEKNLRREILNDEVRGTSKIDELNTRSIPTDEKRELKAMEKKISLLRQKVLSTSEEILQCQKQREAMEFQVSELQRDLEGQEIAYNQLEQSKNVTEERLTDQIHMLETQLSHVVGQQAQFNSELEKMEEMLNTVNEEAQDLQEHLVKLQSELKASKNTSSTLSNELIELLNEERSKLGQLYNEKRSLEQAYRHLEKQHSELLEKIQANQVVVKKQQTLYDAQVEAVDQLKAKNQKLEQTIRRLETRI